MNGQPQLAWLDEQDLSFPDPSEALTQPDGLLAAGGDLSPQRLLHAYQLGIFPWYEPGQPLLWWSPDPRSVLEPHAMQVSRRLARKIRQGRFVIQVNTAFNQVIEACSCNRPDNRTWITAEMIRAYQQMHEAGYAHSIECFMDGQLAGGVYGLSLGNLFFGESMFYRAPDASKIALAALLAILRDAGSPFLDCQISNPHLLSLGAREMPRAEYLQVLAEHIRKPAIDWARWQANPPWGFKPSCLIDQDD